MMIPFFGYYVLQFFVFCRCCTADHHLIDQLFKLNNDQHHNFMNIIKSGICKHLYFDMGTNIGIQIRKLYEPKFYPKSPIRWHFEDILDSEDRQNVCTIGFEPNSLHVPRLVELQAAYRKAGFPLVIFTSSAVGASNGTITFFRAPGQNKHYHESGASSINYWGVQREFNETALLIDVNKLIHRVHSTWIKSTGYVPSQSKLFAKMDIEGSEFTVLPNMLGHGSLCKMHEIMIEWHHRFFPNITAENTNMEKTLLWLSKSASDCGFKMLDIDDNSYADGADKRPFPEPINPPPVYLSSMLV